MDTETQLADRIDDAWAMPRGAAQMAAFEAVVARAEAGGFDSLALDATLGLIEAYHQGGEPAKQFALFSSCLARYRRAPQTFSTVNVHRLRWYHKFVVHGMTRFPSVSLEQTERVLDDMTDEYRRAGSTLHAVHSCRHQLAAHVGRTDLAELEFDRWRTTPRDDLSDCVGCDPENQASWLAATGRDAEAAELADGVLSGRLTCAEQPHSMLTTMLLPYARLGRWDDAVDAHARAYRAIRHVAGETRKIAEHIVFCARTGNEARGLELLERHLPDLDHPADPMTETEFLAAGALLLRRLVETGRGDVLVRGGSVVDVPAAELAVAWRDRATALAAQFDARNGTTAVSERTDAVLTATPLTDALPLHGAARSDRRVRPVPAPEVAPVAPSEPSTAEQLLAAWRGSWRDDVTVAERVARELVDREAEIAALAPGEVERARGFLARTAHDDAGSAAALERAAAAFRSVGDDVSEAAVTVRLAVHHADTDPAGAVGRATAAAQLVAERATDDHVRSDVATDLVLVHGIAGDTDRAVALADALATPTHPADRALVAYTRSQVAAVGGRWEDALAHARAGRQLLLEAGQPVRAARVARILVDALVRTDRAEEAVAVVDDAVARSVGRSRAEWHEVRSEVLLRTGDRTGAGVALTEAVADWTALGAPARAADASVSLGWCLMGVGRPLAAAEAFEAALPTLDANGATDAATQTRTMLLDALERLGDTDDVVRVADAQDALATGEQRWADRARVDSRGADVLSDRNDVRAERLRARALDALERMGDELAAAREQRQLAADTQLRDHDAAMALFETARARTAALPDADGFDRDVEVAACDHLRAWSLWRVDRNEEAVPFAAAAVTGFTAAGAHVPAARSAVLAARLVAERGDADAARAQLDPARAALAAAGDADGTEPVRDEIDELLAGLEERDDR